MANTTIYFDPKHYASVLDEYLIRDMETTVASKAEFYRAAYGGTFGKSLFGDIVAPVEETMEKQDEII